MKSKSLLWNLNISLLTNFIKVNQVANTISTLCNAHKKNKQAKCWHSFAYLLFHILQLLLGFDLRLRLKFGLEVSFDIFLRKATSVTVKSIGGHKCINR